MFLIPVGVIVGVVLLIVASSQQEPVKKKNMKKWGIYSMVLPPILIFVVLSIWGLGDIAGGTAMK